MNGKKGFAKRLFPRVNVDIAAEIGRVDVPADGCKARIINISRDGFFILADLKVRKGGSLSVRFRIPNEPDFVTLRGRVAFLAEQRTVEVVRKGFGMQVSAEGLSDKLKGKLRDYFDSICVYGWFD
jgi:hypothetical protein